jgi:hypothetical protein
MAGLNRTEWTFPDYLFLTMPRTPSLGARDGPHSNSGMSEEGQGGTNDFLLPEGGVEEARRQDGESVGGSGSWSHSQ